MSGTYPADTEDMLKTQLQQLSQKEQKEMNRSEKVHPTFSTSYS